MTSRLPETTLDHLVVAGVTLAQAIEWFADLTGVAARPGGRHETMGTHNALVRLGPRVYLELIAVDPDGARPSRPRWFDLDDPALVQAIGERPRLIHWVARTEDIARSVAAAKHATGPVLPFSRGDYRWRITVPDDGRRPGDGLVPTLIQWDVAHHPADRLPDDGVSLIELAGSHPSPDAIRAALSALGMPYAVRVTWDAKARLAAMLRTPRGLVAL